MRAAAPLAGLALAGSIVAPPPAAAHPGAVCIVVNGRLYTDRAHRYHGSSPSAGDMSTASCTFVFSGATPCGNGIGSGVLDDGAGTHPFTAVWAGGTLTMWGGVTGAFVVVPDAANGESCVSGADVFIVNGVAVTL